MKDKSTIIYTFTDEAPAPSTGAAPAPSAVDALALSTEEAPAPLTSTTPALSTRWVVLCAAGCGEYVPTSASTRPRLAYCPAHQPTTRRRRH